MSNSNIYMGWTFEDVLKASHKLKVIISCDDAELIIMRVSINYTKHKGCTWGTIYNAIRDHVEETKS